MQSSSRCVATAWQQVQDGTDRHGIQCANLKALQQRAGGMCTRMCARSAGLPAPCTRLLDATRCAECHALCVPSSWGATLSRLFLQDSLAHQLPEGLLDAVREGLLTGHGQLGSGCVSRSAQPSLRRQESRVQLPGPQSTRAWAGLGASTKR